MAAIDDLRYYEMIRARLEHEDGMIVNRLSWLMASQSFLFTAYAIAAASPPVIANTASGGLAAIYRLVPWVGVATTTLIYAGLIAAVNSMGWLLKCFRARVTDETALGAPPLAPPWSILRWGMSAPLILPPLFILAWIVLLVALLT